jgi:hypothetical protein
MRTMAEGIGDTWWVLMMLSELMWGSGVRRNASMSMGVVLAAGPMEILLLMESSLLLRIDRTAGKVFGGGWVGVGCVCGCACLP